MFTVVEKVENMRNASNRHKLMIEIDNLIEGDKVFTLFERGNSKGRKRGIRCDIVNKNGKVESSFTSLMCSFTDALRNISRQIRNFKELDGGNHVHSFRR